MRVNFAVFINIVLSILLGIFIFNMLPFAEGVTCDAAKMQGIICDQSRSVLYRIILVLFIVTIVGAISWLGYKFRQSSPKFSALLLSCFPLVILIWLVGWLWSQVFSPNKPIYWDAFSLAGVALLLILASSNRP